MAQSWLVNDNNIRKGDLKKALSYNKQLPHVYQSNQSVSRKLKQVLENKQVHGTLTVDRKKVVIPFGNIWLKSSHGLVITVVL
jgi:hypothetical protein